MKYVEKLPIHEVVVLLLAYIFIQFYLYNCIIIFYFNYVYVEFSASKKKTPITYFAHVQSSTIKSNPNF